MVGSCAGGSVDIGQVGLKVARYLVLVSRNL